MRDPDPFKLAFARRWILWPSENTSASLIAPELQTNNQLARLRPEYSPNQQMIAASLAFLGRLDEASEVLERAGLQPLDPRYQQRPPWLRPQDYALRMEGRRLAAGETT